MSGKQIEVSLIHNLNRTIHEGKLKLIGDYPNCGLIFTSAVNRDIEVKGHDYFKCLTNLRIEPRKAVKRSLAFQARERLTRKTKLLSFMQWCETRYILWRNAQRS